MDYTTAASVAAKHPIPSPKTLLSLPPELTELSVRDFYWIGVYFAVFSLAGVANFWGLMSVIRIVKIRKSSFNFLLCHLSFADCFVIFTVAGGEVLWRISIAWRGGILLCKSSLSTNPNPNSRRNNLGV
jgi:hypothetical protein